MWIIGRGISLAHLSKDHIGAGPVIAINQAIEQIECLDLPNPIYSMQKDHYFLRPAVASILAHKHESAKDSWMELEQANAYIFDNPVDFGLPWNMPSVVTCAALAHRMGCELIYYLCCDSVTDGITEAYGAPATEPQSYLSHGALVRQYARLPVEWIRIDRKN